MSVRIYQLSKEIGMDNNELMELLRERGFQVKSPSSTIDNISAESLMEEFAPGQERESLSDESSEEDLPEALPVAPPSTSFVKSPDDLVRERAAAEAAKKAEAAPKPVASPPPPPPLPPSPSAPPMPAAPKPMAPPSVSAPKPMAPKPMGPPPISAPAPAAPPPISPGVRPAPAHPGVRPPPSVPPRVSAPPPVKPAASVSAAPAPSFAAPPPPPPPASVPTKPAAPAGPSNPLAPPSLSVPSSGAKPVASGEIKTITIKPPIVVRDFAVELGMKPFKLISELMEMGIFASVNQSLEEDIASDVAAKHGFLLEIRHRGDGPRAQQKKKKKEVVAEDEAKLMEPRPPVVCILGHVDHGKTSLLDYIRKANVVKGEAGGITQHIGAYQVDHEGRKITFLDTPGHAAFNAMRARGADVTDVAILIVAADDGFKPQTDEALKFIKNAGVQPIVAINKIDTKGANIERVKQQMQERGIAPEDWGGQTICVPISALTGDGIPELLEMILLQAEMLELKANPKRPAAGVVIEAQVEVGRGSTATVIVQAGTLKLGDALICGPHYTRVKALFNEYGKNLKEAPPATPVRVIGWSGTPDCGAVFETVKNEKEAKAKAAEVEAELKAALNADDEDDGLTPQERLFAAIAATQKKTLRVIVKGDTFGSVEAITQALRSIKSDKVGLEIIGKGVGVISKGDVQKASAAGAEIIGFNVKTENGVAPIAKHHAVKISTYQIIYELIDRVQEDMVEMLDPEYRENKIGAAEVRAVFPIAKGFVAGCLVIEGRVQHNARARVVRKGKTVIESKIETLRRVKDNVKEVRAGTECGIQIEKHNDYKPGDVIEVYEVHEIRPTL